MLLAHAFKGMTVLFAYSMGIALPLLAAALLTGKFINWAAERKKGLILFEKVSGIILAALGVLLFFDKLMFLG